MPNLWRKPPSHVQESQCLCPWGQDPGWQQPWGSALRGLCLREVSLPRQLRHQWLTFDLQKLDSERRLGLGVRVGAVKPGPSLRTIGRFSPALTTYHPVQAAAEEPRARSALELAIQLGRPDVPSRFDEREYFTNCVQVLNTGKMY